MDRVSDISLAEDAENRVDDLKDSLEKAAPDDARTWVVWLARFGFAAKGFVYIVMGVLALQVYLRIGGETTGPTGAIESIGRQPFGMILLILIGVGLLGYAMWRFVEAFIDPTREGHGVVGLTKRLGYAISGSAHVAFALSALAPSLGRANTLEKVTARVMSHPLGGIALGLVALGLIGTGFYQFYRTYSADFREQLRVWELKGAVEHWVIWSGRIGFAARGVVYCLVGLFLGKAVVESNPYEAGGIGEALRELGMEGSTPWMLGVVASGLVLYGVFAMVQAKYQRIYLPQ